MQAIIDVIGDLDPREELYSFDAWPMIFTAKTKSGGLVLAYALEEMIGGIRYLVADTTEAEIVQLRRCELDVRDAILRRLRWVVEIDDAGRVSGARPALGLPEDALPEPGVKLYATAAVPA